MGQISDLLAKNLSMMLVDKGAVRDPRLSNITITEVVVSRDISTAKVYYILPEGQDDKEVNKSLNKAAGFFRAALAEKLALRVIPRLYFSYDISIEKAARIQNLLDSSAPTNPEENED